MFNIGSTENIMLHGDDDDSITNKQSTKNWMLLKTSKSAICKLTACILIFILVFYAIQQSTSNLGNLKKLKQEQKKQMKVQMESLMEIKKDLERLHVNRHCPHKWIFHNNLCYYVSKKEERVSWEEAKEKCKAMENRATLAMPKTMEENIFLKQLNNFTDDDLSHQDLWLGGSDTETEGIWKWADDSLISLDLQEKNWAPNQPNNWGGIQNCLKLYFHGGKYNRAKGIDGKFWDDGICSFKKHFLCSLDLSFGCPLGWQKNNGNCYYFSDILLTTLSLSPSRT